MLGIQPIHSEQYICYSFPGIVTRRPEQFSALLNEEKAVLKDSLAALLILMIVSLNI